MHLNAAAGPPQKPDTARCPRVAANLSWFAIRTRARAEFVAAGHLLQRHGIEAFVPTFSETVLWSNRSKVTVRPLFPGYLFARFNLASAPAVRGIYGVVQILSINQSPVPIPDDEIAALRDIVEHPVPFVRGSYVAGTTVTVERGPFAGRTSVISRIKGGTLLTLLVPIFGRPTPVQVESADVKLTAPEKKAPK